MLRTILWFTYFVLYKLRSLPWLAKINYLQKHDKQRQAEEQIANIAYNWARSLIKYTGTTVKVNGLENIPQRNVLFVSNHQGYFDIPLLIGYINKPKGFIAKAELKKIPIISAWMKKIHCVFMDRNDIRQSIRAIQKGVKILKSGKSMVIFPEGTRSKSNTLGTFKPGSMKLALKSGVPIVPVTINGSYKILEQNDFIIKPTQVEIVISKPVYVDKLTKEERANLAPLVRDKVAQHLYN